MPQSQPKATNNYVLSLQDINSSALSLTGGKGANLGELCSIGGIHIPGGFCVTTEAYRAATINNVNLENLLTELDNYTLTDKGAVIQICGRIRKLIEVMPMPENVVTAVTEYLSKLGEGAAYAVRSSATAEDLPGASFAGQQDTYLNIIGKDEILRHISRCWASLFTDRAVTYRMQNGFQHHKVQLAVVVQQMVFPQAAGILFTADPINGNRKVTSIDAGFGLGEAMVSGLVNADNYKVHDGVITAKNIPAKKLAIYALKEGGTQLQGIAEEKQLAQVLMDEQVLQLEQIGRKIEAHFGQPQDIEWCLADGVFYIVQSRPITTLYPIPGKGDSANHVYVSVGHQQMMTDAMKPLGISVWLLSVARHMDTAGGRLFVDITQQLSSSTGRQTLMDTLGKSDPLIKDALITIMERDFVKLLPADEDSAGKTNTGPFSPGFQTRIDNNPAIVNGLIKRSEEMVYALQQNIITKQGVELFNFILEDVQQLKKFLFENLGAILTAVNTSAWINEKMAEWLDEKNAADVLSQSVPNNVTAEMGLALMDVADIIRPYHAVIDYLQQVKSDAFLNALTRLEGGPQAAAAINAYLDKYGMRCAREIDITRPRWSEQPSTLIPIILNNIKNFEPGAAKRKFEEGLQLALNKENELLERLKQLPDGEQKAEETKRIIWLLRSFVGYREYPKYTIVNHYFFYKQALLKEAKKLAQANIINEAEDAFYLTLEEFREVVRTQTLDYNIITQRKQEYTLNEKLSPPRMITSEGEIISGYYKREGVPANAMAGLAVSSGIVEGRARVILNMQEANLEDGDILVTKFTDPSWTPLFLSIKGLVTEVGGLMTHGAVIAREYGLPAVVAVEHATSVIKDGQQIRVNGTEGYVEIL